MFTHAVYGTHIINATRKQQKSEKQGAVFPLSLNLSLFETPDDHNERIPSGTGFSLRNKEQYCQFFLAGVLGPDSD